MSEVLSSPLFFMSKSNTLALGAVVVENATLTTIGISCKLIESLPWEIACPIARFLSDMTALDASSLIGSS
jgi:hypothetical protein